MKNKKSFLLYADFREIFETLSDKEAGQLIKAIFNYADGGEVKLPSKLSLCFIPIRQMLDRNANKYEQICEKRRQAGAKGGQKKAENLANVANATFAYQNVANLPDNDNDNVNDNDNDIILSNNISDSERKLLLDFAKEQVTDKRKYLAYYNTIIKNGDYVGILAEIKAKEAQRKKLAEIQAAEEREQNPAILSFSQYSDNALLDYLQKNRNFTINGKPIPPVLLAQKEAARRGLSAKSI